MTNKEAIKLIQGIEEDGMNVTSEHVEALTKAIEALENQPFDVDEYRKRLVDKYSEGDEATDVDNGITIALDLLWRMTHEKSQKKI